MNRCSFFQSCFCTPLILVLAAYRPGDLCAADPQLTVEVGQFAEDQFGSEVKTDTEGLRIKAVNPVLPPIATARDLDLTITRNQWLIVRMKADKGQFGSLWISPKSGPWLPHGTKVESQFAFPIRADGDFHTYQVWLGDSRLMPLKEGRTYDLALSYKFRLIRSSSTGPIAATRNSSHLRTRSDGRHSLARVRRTSLTVRLRCSSSSMRATPSA